jgi:hypothetical protein
MLAAVLRELFHPNKENPMPFKTSGPAGLLLVLLVLVLVLVLLLLLLLVVVVLLMVCCDQGTRWGTHPACW